MNTEYLDILRGVIGVLGIEGWLIILTLFVSSRSYLSQQRASIREAIEQLDPRLGTYQEVIIHSGRRYAQSAQIRPGLNGYYPFRRKVKIGFFSNAINEKADRVVRHSVPPFYLTIPEDGNEEYKPLGERILAHNKIENVERTDNQIIITCNTTNPVQCRQISAYVLDQHDSSENCLIHQSDFRPKTFDSV